MKAVFFTMGRVSRQAPARLGEKLRRLREGLGLSRLQLAELLFDRPPVTTRTRFSMYEAGEREPSLLVLLRYARIAGITIDHLADDVMELPESLTFQPPKTPPLHTPVAAAHRVARRAPDRLAQKLLQLRQKLNLSQTDIARVLFDRPPLTWRAVISMYEYGDREPSLLSLLRYARIAGITIDVLADDALDLPEPLIFHPPSLPPAK